MNEPLKLMVDNARLAVGSPGEEFGVAACEAARFELFHAANSICSQKVRVVLMQHDLGFVSHALNLFEGQTYLPAYVRLRMLGCDSLGGELVSHHSGSTSTSSGGCDGAVVPTLIDRMTGQVIVDSKRICLHLDDLAPEPTRLRPATLADRIDEELAIVDNLPNYQILMGRKPGTSERASSRNMTGPSFSERKVALCDRYLSEHAGDATLKRAYEAKRAKESSAAARLFSEDAMAEAYDRAEASIQTLDRRLVAGNGAWLFGDVITMADLFWGTELLRMQNVGAGRFWEGGRLARVEEFLSRVAAVPSVRSAITDWAGATY